ncbi:MAG: aspartate carbamoyltransferase [Candidatus Gracilibacteria bacterium]|nr:aspartate carbamoyltransferase [Candidatus Gracilibacteria bacterium]
MQHILSSDQFTREQLLEIFNAAKKLQDSKEIPQTMKGKILATVFLEPSTRTRLSFETSMLKLGGQVISIPNSESSSLNKGESLEDTGRMIDSYADIIAMRVPKKGQVNIFSTHISTPVINAGDGTGDHPTQNLLDLYTIWKEHGKLDGLTIGLMGDCCNSRVLRGMAKMLAEFDCKLIFIAPPEVQMRIDVKSYLKSKGKDYKIVESLDEVITDLDALEVNRIRHEYFEDKERAKEIGKQFIISKQMLEKGKEKLILLDPLPRINTYLEEVDEMPQAKYFEAVTNSLFVRMALINSLLG